MEKSILESTKKLLGIASNETSFDEDVLAFINTAFLDLEQFGIGPSGGFSIEDNSSVWSDFLEDVKALRAVKAYVYLKVKLLFDPPSSSFVIKAYTDQIQEAAFRLVVQGEPPEV